MDKRLLERFFGKVVKTKSCWVWSASKSGRGYGAFEVKIDSRWKRAYAHRVSWEIHFGDIPPGMLVCHKCDNPSCVNPEHLFLGTIQDNQRDMKSKGRAWGRPNGPGCYPPGEAHPSAKLKENQVREIRKRFGKEKITKQRLAEEYNVHPKTISQIIKREIWRNVQ